MRPRISALMFALFAGIPIASAHGGHLHAQLSEDAKLLMVISWIVGVLLLFVFVLWMRHKEKQREDTAVDSSEEDDAHGNQQE